MSGGWQPPEIPRFNVVYTEAITGILVSVKEEL